MYTLRLLLAAYVLLTMGIEARPRDGRALERLVPQLMRDGRVPGLSVVLIRNRGVVWQRAFGVANAETGAPLADDAIFESASLAKPVFAYAVLKLVDEGVLSLDEPLSAYFDEPVPDPRMRKITARMVLTHTTGYQNEVMPGKTLQMHFEPGSRFSYSGAGFLRLQRVVEHLAGKAFAALMQDLVFTPLGMRDSGYVWVPEYEQRKVYGHSRAGETVERRRPAVATMATLHTTPRDYARFTLAVMNGTGLKPATAAAMRSAQVAVDASCHTCLQGGSGTLSTSLSWGLGWGIEKTARGTSLWHWGENNGDTHTFVMARDDGDAVIVFANSGNGHSIMPDLVGAVLEGEHPAFAWMGYPSYRASDVRGRPAGGQLIYSAGMQKIVPPGTQVVASSAVPIVETANTLPGGAVGVIVRAPADATHSYRIRFVDGSEASLKRDEFRILHAVRDSGVGEGEEIDWRRFVIFRCIVGSRAFGLDTDASDVDRRGIYLPPAELQWALYGVPEQFENDETQEVYWELAKFLRLALKANPGILECLWSPLVEQATELARELLAMRTAFLSRLVYQTYNGYVLSQFKKIEQDVRTRGEVRWKHPMHLIRLLLSGIAILREGEVPVRVDEHRDALLAIRRGEMPWEKIDAWRLALHREFDEAFRRTKLPERPDFERANAFLLAARRSMV